MSAPICNRCGERPSLFDTFGGRRLHHCACEQAGPHCWRRRRDGTWQLWFGWPLERWVAVHVVDGVAQVPEPEEILGRAEVTT